MKDLIIIIGTKNLKKFFLLSILTVIAALFEAFSIGLILPIISIINTSDFSNYPNYLKYFIKILEVCIGTLKAKNSLNCTSNLKNFIMIFY